MSIRRFAPWLALAVVLAGCAMPIQAPPLKAQPQQAEQALPLERAPQQTAPDVFVPEVVAPAVVPVTTGTGYPAKPRELFELDHMGQP